MSDNIENIDLSAVRLLSNRRFGAFCTEYAGVTAPEMISMTVSDIRRLFMVWWSLPESEGGPTESFRSSFHQ